MISYVDAFFSMPSWWMPLSCAKAFEPTMALLGCTDEPVKDETMRDVLVIWWARYIVGM